MKGELVLVDEILFDNQEFELNYGAYDFSLVVYVDGEKTLEKQLKNKDKFKKCMEEKFGSIRKVEMDGLLEEEVEISQYIENNFESLLDSVEFIRLSLDSQSPKEFIEKNPIILSKKIVLEETLRIDEYDKLIELINKYKDIVDQVYVSLNGNENYVSLLDCYKTMNKIKKQADNIRNLGLSPMETIMYLYDQVRNRIYTKENEDEERFKSRDLSEVIFGNKIVCAGYSAIFSAVLSYLDIKNSPVFLIDKDDIKNESGHERNVVYVKDPKYNIDGVYYFDTTFDSKRKDENNSYLYRYNFFAKTKNSIDKLDKKQGFNFEDTFFQYYSTDMYEKVETIVNEKKYDELLEYLKTINYMGKLVGEDRLIDVRQIIPQFMHKNFDKEAFLEKFKVVCDKYNNELPAEVMIGLLNNVRKIQYYQNPEWYPYSLEDLYITSMNSGWQFNEEHLNKEQRLLQLIFGEEISPVNNFRNYMLESNILDSPEQVKLTKVLQLVRDNKEKI